LKNEGTKHQQMDGFSYSDIFATKGIEYLIIITFLLLLTPFWLLLNKQAKIKSKIQKALGFLSASVLKIPQGLYYSKNHTWMYMQKSGDAKVGLDDLLLHITGEVTFSQLRKRDEVINKGDLLAEINQKGKLLRILSPVTGTIVDANTGLNEDPGLLSQDPYGKGWIYKIKPTDWISDIRSCYFAEEAITWSSMELDRFKDFLAVTMKHYSPDPSLVILQDGGELCDHSLSGLPREIWKDFECEFLKLS